MRIGFLDSVFSFSLYKLVENEKLMTLLLFFVVSRKSILEELKLFVDVFMDTSELSGHFLGLFYS